MYGSIHEITVGCRTDCGSGMILRLSRRGTSFIKSSRKQTRTRNSSRISQQRDSTTVRTAGTTTTLHTSKRIVLVTPQYTRQKGRLGVAGTHSGAHPRRTTRCAAGRQKQFEKEQTKLRCKQVGFQKVSAEDPRLRFFPRFPFVESDSCHPATPVTTTKCPT
eukprot:COSAG02_NODE_5791_length_4032_cov_13.154844_3_plen_162_part_00